MVHGKRLTGVSVLWGLAYTIFRAIFAPVAASDLVFVAVRAVLWADSPGGLIRSSVGLAFREVHHPTMIKISKPNASAVIAGTLDFRCSCALTLKSASVLLSPFGAASMFKTAGSCDRDSVRRSDVLTGVTRIGAVADDTTLRSVVVSPYSTVLLASVTKGLKV